MWLEACRYQNFYVFYLFSNIIDVGALECHTLEQHEYIERVRTYNQRLQVLSTNKVQMY